MMVDRWLFDNDDERLFGKDYWAVLWLSNDGLIVVTKRWWFDGWLDDDGD